MTMSNSLDLRTVANHNTYIIKCLANGKKKMLYGSDYFKVVDLIPVYKNLSEDEIHEYLVIFLTKGEKSENLKVFASSARSVKQYLGRDRDLYHTQKILINLDDDEVEVYYRANNRMWGWQPFSKVETLFLLTQKVENALNAYNKEAVRINADY